MEDKEKSASAFDDTYNKLICQDDFGMDEQPLYSKQEKPHVSMSIVRPESPLNHYRLLAIGLTVLAVVLLAADIGLGVYYNTLTSGHRTVADISREIARLQVSYNAALLSREEARQQLAKELSQQRVTKWDLEHQKKRNNDYKRQADKLQMEIAVLSSHMPMIKEGCRHCLPGWTFMNSKCYFFAFSEALSRRSWQQARQFCTRQGADLAVIDSKEEQLAINELINHYKDPLRSISQSGFWIGLRDVIEEDTWRWLDGRRLTEGYWNDGEPNNQNNEDCAATYPRLNPFKGWNDAPCNYDLKWICEMVPRSQS